MGLELLIRDKTGRGYQLKVLDSNDAFLRLVPRQHDNVQVNDNPVESADGRRWMLHVAGAGTGSYMRVDERQHFIWQQVDGQQTIQDIASAFFFRFGSFELDEIRRFLREARRCAMLEVAERPRGLARVRKALPKGRLEALLRQISQYERRFRQVDPAFQTAARRLRLLLNRWTAPVWLAAAAWAVVTYASGRFGAAATLSTDALPWVTHVPLFIAFAAGFLLMHEAAHGLVCAAFGREVKAVGVTFLNRVIPTLYVDVTDMWMSTRAGRIAVALAGPLANLAAAPRQIPAAPHPRTGPQHPRHRVAADVNMLTAAYTAWPFTGLPEDGYEAVTDATGVAGLQRRATGFLRALVSQRRLVERRVGMISLYVLYLAGVAATWAGIGGLLLSRL